MEFRLEIDQSACIGSGSCVHDTPAAFALNGAGLAEVLQGIGSLAEEDLFRIARNCPSGAIIVYDEEGSSVDVFGAA
jgi:ferredoxin